MNNKREELVSLINTMPEENVSTALDLVAGSLEKFDPSKAVSESSTLDKKGYIIFEQTYDFSLYLNDVNKLELSYKGRFFDVFINPSTLMPKKYIKDNEKLYIIAKFNDTDCTAQAIVNESFYSLFDAIDSTEDKLEYMRRFDNASPDLKKSIRNQLSGRKFKSTRKERLIFKDLESLRLKFNMCKSSYSPQQQKDIESMFTDARNVSGQSARERTIRRLTYMLNIDQNSANEITLSKAEIITELDKHLFGHTKLKEKLAEAIVASKYTDKKGFNLLLVGSPGVGKTAIMKALAAVLDVPFFLIPMGSSSSILDYVGDAPHYDASDCGEVIKHFFKVGSTRVVLGLDEFDKAYSNDKEGGKVSKVFNDALSDEHFFKDVFLGTYICTDNTIFVATANSTEDISPYLINRFNVIHIDDYTDDEKVKIAQNFIIPRTLAQYKIRADEIIFNDEALRHIISNYCVDEGARDLNKNIKNIVVKVLAIWDSTGIRTSFTVEKDFVDTTLEFLVDEDSPTVIYKRNKHLYSPAVSEEIKSLLSKVKDDNIDGDLKDKYTKKLNYLVNLIPIGDAFSKFDKKAFYKALDSSHFGMAKVKKEIAQIFNLHAINKTPLSSLRLLLSGPFGSGKTSIAKAIAKACNAEFCKISLNGISDESSLKGHSFSYVGADAGIIFKSIAKAKTSKLVVLLDEIDKLGSREGVSASNTLVDLLDDSSAFTDNFVGQIDLSNVLFICTANDLSTVPPVLMDRLTLINLDGYTTKEKAEIVSRHIIPEAIAGSVPSDYTIEFTDEAKSLIVNTYCRSMGLRDAKKAVQKLIKDKVYMSDSNKLVIDGDYAKSVLGAPPSERGNFPSEVYPGLAKALAVTGNNCGMSFAVETMLIPDEESLTITGLAKEDTSDSVKLAISYVKRNYPGLLKNTGVHIHFGEGAVPKSGPSAGVTILMSLLSAVFNTPIKDNVAYTGEINGNGFVFNIGGTVAKIQAAEQSGCSKVFIPYGNYTELEPEVLEQFNVEVIPVKHISEVINAIFPTQSMSRKI